MTTLDVLISTINERIHNVPAVLLPPRRDVRYVVCWQQDGYDCAMPQALVRDDVTLLTLQGRGTSRNRNHAIKHSTADICLVADDDVEYNETTFSTILDTFEANPSLDVATFRSDSIYEKKCFPDTPFNLATPAKNYYVSAIEIAFRRSTVAPRVLFNELTGPGAPVLQAAEDSFFALEAVIRGLNCQFFPKTIVTHNHISTGITPIQSPGTIMSQGAYIRVAYQNPTRYIRYVLKAWRMSRASNANFFFALHHILRGARYARKEFKYYFS